MEIKNIDEISIMDNEKLIELHNELYERIVKEWGVPNEELNMLLELENELNTREE